MYKLFFLLVTALIFVGSNITFSQDIHITKNKSGKGAPFSNQKFPLTLRKHNEPLTRTQENNFSESKQEIEQQIQKIKRPDNLFQEGDKILALQRELEKSDGTTNTKQPDQNESFVRIVPGSQGLDNIQSTILYTGDYNVAFASQVEQRGSNAGRVWFAVGHSDLDTGATAKPDTIVLYYTDNGGASYTQYVSIAFSSANKIGFDDLDMEIIEPSSGTKYIYMVFGYYTDGYYGSRRIGYTIVTTPSLAVFGSTLNFPGQTSSSIYFNARVASDNARYPSVPYVNIVVMQDSIAGSDHNILTKFCRVLSPYALNPAITYFPKSIYLPATGFYDYSAATDIAYYHNGSDSLIFILSAYPGYAQNIYTYKAFGNSSVYPVPSGILTPTGYDIDYARVASNGGTNQTKLMMTFTDNYQNSFDYDQYIATAPDASTWTGSSIEFTGLYDSHCGDVLGRRDADGSFSVAFRNDLNSMSNATSCSFNGDFNMVSYLHALNTDYANSVANPKPSFRYINSDSCLTVWSRHYISSTSSGCDVTNFYLIAGNQGYYDEVDSVNRVIDFYEVYLAEPFAPYNIVDTSYVHMDYKYLMNEVVFKNSPEGTYYIVLRHLNALETWSAVPVLVTHSFINSYDFTDQQSSSYGSNTVQKNDEWLLYSGDMNDDGVINLTDLTTIYNDVVTFEVGQYLASDLTGDYVVGLDDLVLVYNNSLNFVHTIRP